MSDLTSLFGNNDDVILSKPNGYFSKDHYITTNKKKILRPNTLKMKKESLNNHFKQKHIKSPDINNGVNLKNVSKYPLTPADVCVNLFESFHSTNGPFHGSLSCSDLYNLPNQLPPENADGNIEYKRQLLNLTPLRLQHLITQLKWRLAEGEGQAIYEIGVNDDGKVSGLGEHELLESVNNLYKMAETLDASVSIIREYNVGSRKAVEILVRKVPTHFSTHEIRVAVLGNMDAGKSTLIGVLTQGVLDNGQGKTRLSTFRHVHEVRSGRTSSISCQLLGFDVDENLFNFYWQKNRLHQRSHEEVVLSSSKLVALIDLAGYHKYQRTTLFALTARRPHLVLLVIPANHGFKGTSIDHCQFAITLGVSIVVVVTKIDRGSPNEAINQFAQWLNSRCIKSPLYTVNSINEAKQAASNIDIDKSIPVFPVSCVSGVGIDILTTFLGTLKKPEEDTKHHQAEVWIDQIHYEVPRVDGCVVVGLVCTGLVNENVYLYLGPQKDGNFILVTVQSIHRNRVQQTTVENGQYASFAVCLPENEISQTNCSNGIGGLRWIPQSPTSPEKDITDHCVRRGMVLLANPPDSNIDYVYKHVNNDNSFLGQVVWGVVVTDIRMFDDQEVSITDLQKQQGSWIVHCGNVYQKCEMLNLDILSRTYKTSEINEAISHDDIIFHFKLFPQFVHANYPVVFHKAGQTIKACGNIKLFLGGDTFQKRDCVESQKKVSDNDNGRLTHFFPGNHFKTRKLKNNDSDDEYFTAPSSPILSE